MEEGGRGEDRGRGSDVDMEARPQERLWFDWDCSADVCYRVRILFFSVFFFYPGAESTLHLAERRNK